jgi:hypothetical protein
MLWGCGRERKGKLTSSSAPADYRRKPFIPSSRPFYPARERIVLNAIPKPLKRFPQTSTVWLHPSQMLSISKVQHMKGNLIQPIEKELIEV